MEAGTSQPHTPTAIRTDLAAIFVSLELSRSTWLITSLSPGNGEKMSKHSVVGGDVTALLGRVTQLQEKVRSRTGNQVPIVSIQEAGLDGFWIDRVLKANGIESYVVDPASIATSRRRRRAKTDKLDGEALVRAYSGDAGRLFQSEAGQVFQSHAGHDSDLKPDSWRAPGSYVFLT